jgi:hypothetical protein
MKADGSGGIGQKEHNGDDVEETRPLAAIDRVAEVRDDPHQYRDLKQDEVQIEARMVLHTNPQNGGENDGGMSEDHGQDKTKQS